MNLSERKAPIIYAIPGLSTDRRIFQRLELEGEVRFLDWIEPKPAETLSNYAHRMAEKITTSETFILLGLSFGGIVAQEMASFLSVQKVILLSSIKSKEEMPLQFRLFRSIPFYRLSKGSWRIKLLPLWAPSFGITSKEEQVFLQEMFSGFSDMYRMWAIKELTNWNPTQVQVPIHHIHGEKDKVFPLSYIQQVEMISGGNHFMVYQRAKEVSERINALL